MCVQYSHSLTLKGCSLNYEINKKDCAEDAAAPKKCLFVLTSGGNFNANLSNVHPGEAKSVS